jgi:hypothetical protein
MGLKDVDIESALRRLAERRIEDAMREGKFDNLAGRGKPLDLEPMPADENARLMWWALRIMRSNNFTPDEVRWRKQVETLKDELASATTEARVRVIVKAVNDLVRQLNTLGTNAINSPVNGVTLEEELRRLRERQRMAVAVTTRFETAARAVADRHCRTEGCGLHNPGSARFCRRCGAVLG